MKQKRLLLLAFILLFVLPLIGSYLKWDGFPPGYGEFPAQKVMDDPPFYLPAFIVCSGIALAILLFLLVPKIFGFKKVISEAPPKDNTTKYPPWFIPGLVVTLVSWFFMWGRFDIVEPIDHFTFVPLWWGFIFVLDGLVYKRNNGVSLWSSRPNTMKLLAVASSFSWFVFEYQNFFVLENWYYPNSNIFSNFGNISWQLLSYTTVLPAIFEWYWLLCTSKTMRERYAHGPTIKLSTSLLYILLIAGWVSLILMGYFPHQLFFLLWFGLVPALVPAMAISKLWSPFTPIGEKGDWSFVILIALATLLNGFFWEFWNFGSEWFHHDAPTNPNYWKYSVPYLDAFHLFSEMPILGYFGYLFFGVVCWVLWLCVAYLVNFDHSGSQFEDGYQTQKNIMNP